MQRLSLRQDLPHVRNDPAIIGFLRLVVALQAQRSEIVAKQVSPALGVRIMAVRTAMSGENRPVRRLGIRHLALHVVVACEAEFLNGRTQHGFVVRRVSLMASGAPFLHGLVDCCDGEQLLLLVLVAKQAVVLALSAAQQETIVTLVRLVAGGALSGGERPVKVRFALDAVALLTHQFGAHPREQELGV